MKIVSLILVIGIFCSINAADCIMKYDKNGCDEVVFDVGSDMKVQQYKVIYDKDQDGVVDALDKCPGTLYGVKVDKGGCKITTPVVVSKVEPVEDKILAEVEKNQVETRTLSVEFDTLKSKIKKNYLPEIEEFARYLKKNPRYFLKIVGHTDGNDKYNINVELSKSRADAVKEVLVKNGVEKERIETVGMGPNEPVATNATKEGRAKNRRIEVTLTTKEEN